MEGESGFRVYTRMVGGYSAGGTGCGSNLGIFEDFCSELEAGEAEEVHLALYLFNNPSLYQRALQLASRGAKVVVTTIPLAGYDDRKIASARQVYSQALSDGAIELKIFPHMYFWYGAEYAGGGASYSLHIKAAFVKLRDGTCRAILSSGNMAPGDPTHTEAAASLHAPASSPTCKSFAAFFGSLEARAKPYSEYAEASAGLSGALLQAFDFSFVAGANPQDFGPAPGASDALFTAPFVTYGGMGSPHCARELLAKTMLSARSRLLVCAQHVHDLMPFDGYAGKTLVRALIELKKERPEADVRVLKQVASSGLADKRRAAFAEAHLHYAGVPQKANRLAHEKFVVADGAAALGTGNFTSTQFGWGARQMECTIGSVPLAEAKSVVDRAAEFFGTPRGRVRAISTRPRKGSPKTKVIKEDTFCEVNGLFLIRDPAAAEALARHFERLWAHPCSSDVEIPF